ncbi:hypothetical protein [Nocardia sp. NPDC004722]
MIEESDAVFARAWAACFLDEYADEIPDEDQQTDADEETADEDDDEYEGYDEYEEFAELETDFELGDGYSLHITSWSYGSALSLRHPGAAEPVEIGAEDLVTWQPHTLRWSEADLLCRAAALADPDAVHPGPRLALLGRFAPICTDRDAEVAVPLLRAAFDTLTELDAYQRRAYATHGDVRTYGVDWHRDEESGRWYFEDSAQENPYRDDPDAADHRTGELYSMRDREHDEFPFAALASAVERARSRCAMVREQPWARHPGVGAAAETFAADPTDPHRTALLTALHDAECADPAVLSALSADADELRALVMTELLLGLEPGRLVRTHSRPTPPPRRYHARVLLPVPSGDAPREGLAATLKPHLNAALRTAGLGSTRHGPARVGRLDGTYVDELPLLLLDDWQAATDVTRDVLLAADLPPGSSLQVTRRGETVDIPLRPDTPIDPDR